MIIWLTLNHRSRPKGLARYLAMKKERHCLTSWLTLLQRRTPTYLTRYWGMVKLATDKLGEEEIKTLNNELFDVKLDALVCTLVFTKAEAKG